MSEIEQLRAELAEQRKLVNECMGKIEELSGQTKVLLDELNYKKVDVSIDADEPARVMAGLLSQLG